MKKILPILIVLLLTGCGKEDIQNAAHERQVTQDASYDAGNNIYESLSEDCASAQDVVEVASRANLIVPDSISVKYECHGEDNVFNPTNGKAIWSIKNFICVVLGILTTFSILAIGFTKQSALMESKSARIKNMPTQLMEGILGGLMIMFIFQISLYVIKVSEGWGDEMLIGAAAIDKYKESSAPVPNFSVKSGTMVNITDYLICVKANSLPDSIQNPAIQFYNASWGVGFKGSYEICDLEGGIAIDYKGAKIAEGLGFNYIDSQQQAVITHLTKFIKDSDQIATTYSKGLHGSLMSYDFEPTGLGCDIGSLTAVDTTYFDARQLEKYKVFATDCRSRELVFNLVKAKGMTMNSLDAQEVTLHHRNIQVCSGMYEDKRMLTKPDQLAVYKACVESNCNDLVGTGSPYACSTALNKYQFINDTRFQTVWMLPVSDPKRRIAMNDSAEIGLNTLNAKFSFLDERKYFDSVGDKAGSVSVSKVKGDITMSEVKKAFDTGDKSYLEMALQSVSIDKVLSYFNTSDGFAGTQRFIDCLQNPNSMFKGFDCGSSFEEMQRYGMTLTATALQLKMANSLYNSPVKRVKPKASDFGVAEAKTTISSMASSLFSSAGEKISKKTIAMFLPVISDGVGILAGEKAFGQKYYEMTGQKGEFYVLMALVASSEEASNIINHVSTGMFALGQTFIYMLPLMDYFNFIAIVSIILFQCLFVSTTRQLHWIINLDTTPERRDLDRSPTIIFLEKLLFVFPCLVSGYLLSPILFTGTMMFLIGDLNEFSGSLVALNNVVGATFIASFVSIFVVIITYSICASMQGMFEKFFIAKYHGEVTKFDLKVQGTSEMKAMAKAYKGKI